MSRARIRTASAIIRFGAWLDQSVLELGLVLEPRFETGDDRARQASRAWPGILVIVLLALGIAFVGVGVDWAVREVLPHREAQP